MTELLSNYLGGRWQAGTELVRVDASGLDLAAGFDFAREQGGPASVP